MLTFGAITLFVLGLMGSLVMQVWVQPRWFRDDNRATAKLITDRFDAQIEALTSVSANSAKALDEAAEFFRTSEARCTQLEQRMSILEQQWATTHHLVSQVAKLDRRITVRDAVCNARHENSGRIELPEFDDDILLEAK